MPVSPSHDHTSWSRDATRVSTSTTFPSFGGLATSSGDLALSFAVHKLLRHLIASFQLSVRKLRIRRLPVKGKVGLPYALYPTPDLAEGHPHVSPPSRTPLSFPFFKNSTKASKPHIARSPVPRATPF